jgi:hypothetical protein
VPFVAFDDERGGTASLNDESIFVLLTFPFICEVGLSDGGVSARDESLLSRVGDSRRLLDEARGEGVGRPSLLMLLLLPNGTKPLLGDGARANAPCML